MDIPCSFCAKLQNLKISSTQVSTGRAGGDLYGGLALAERQFILAALKCFNFDCSCAMLSTMYRYYFIIKVVLRQSQQIIFV